MRKGLQIMESLRGHTTGYAVPEYVIDAPGGGGKVPVTPEYVLSRNADRVVIRNYEGKIFEYPEAKRRHAAGRGAARRSRSRNWLEVGLTRARGDTSFGGEPRLRRWLLQ